MKATDFKSVWKPVFVVLALMFLYATVVSRLVGHWWIDENYSHGLLVPFVVGYIIWFRWEALKNIRRCPSLLAGGVLVAIAILLLFAGTLGAELFIQRISLVLMLAGVVVYFFGVRILRTLSVPFLLFLLSIPIPQILFNKIAFPLQIYASRFAVWGIRFFGVPTVRKGNVIEILPEGSIQVIALEVVEACSGIRSLMTLVALALILVFFTRKSDFTIPDKWSAFLRNTDFWRGLILMATAVPVAVITNAGRVSATGVFTYSFGVRATEGFLHELSGWLVYIVALAVLIGINYLLIRILGRIDSSETGESDGSSNMSQSGRTAVLPLIIVLAAGGLFINWFETRGEIIITRSPLSSLPSEIRGWEHKGEDIRFSPETESVLKTSDYVMREYIKEGRIANVYIGYYASQKTGATYHSPQNCLPGSGWEMKKPEFISIKKPSGETFEANRYVIENGKYKEVMLYWYQGRGRTQASEYRDKIFTVLDSVTKRRSDGSMIRIMTPAGNSEAEATASAIELAAGLSETLSEFVPD